jgi:hypothetical protein
VVDVAESVPTPAAREGVAYMGCAGDATDRRAVEYLCDEVMPLLRERFSDQRPIGLHVYAAVPGSMVRRLSADDVSFRGPVTHHAEAFTAHRLLALPVGTDASTRARVAEALGQGIPQVLSAAVLERTGLRLGPEVLVADRLEAWADHIASLCSNADAWHAISKASLQYARQHLSFGRGQESMIAALERAGRHVTPSPDALVVRYARPGWMV